MPTACTRPAATACTTLFCTLVLQCWQLGALARDTVQTVAVRATGCDCVHDSVLHIGPPVLAIGALAREAVQTVAVRATGCDCVHDSVLHIGPPLGALQLWEHVVQLHWPLPLPVHDGGGGNANRCQVEAAKQRARLAAHLAVNLPHWVANPLHCGTTLCLPLPLHLHEHEVSLHVC